MTSESLAAGGVAVPARLARGGWLANRRISTKIYIVVAVVSAVAIWVGVLALERVRVTNDTLTRLGELNVLRLRAIGDIRGGQAAINNDVANTLAPDPPMGRAVAKEMLAEDLTRTEVMIATCAELTRGTAGGPDAQVLHPEFQVFRNGVTVYLVGDDPIAGVPLVEGPQSLGEKSLAIDQRVATLAEFERRDAAAVAARGREAYRQSVMIIVGALVASLLLATTIATLVVRAIARPIGEVRTVLQAVADGDLSREVAVSGSDEISGMGRNLNHTIGVLRSAFDDLRDRAEHDALTGLANRFVLMDCLEQALKRVQEGQPDAGGLAILLVDLDSFKEINDVFGHETGDSVLVEVARRLRSTVRGTDLVARHGGDEFAIIIERYGAATVPLELAKRVCATVSQPMAVGGVEIIPNVSIGVARLSEGEQVDDLLRNADIAMYAAKNAGLMNSGT
ncbi:MAG: sensor domain-containing diguanylate cyclase [Micromonosporaceae bacterium]|nr:sensor domain-containing diguanylate cyclase [Micromonosporaceae bacterium]